MVSGIYGLGHKTNTVSWRAVFVHRAVVVSFRLHTIRTRSDRGGYDPSVPCEGRRRERITNVPIFRAFRTVQGVFARAGAGPARSSLRRGYGGRGTSLLRALRCVFLWVSHRERASQQMHR